MNYKSLNYTFDLCTKLQLFRDMLGYYGQSESAMKVDTWWYRGKHLYPAYDTDQKFLDDDEWTGSYSLLPAYHINNVGLIASYQARIDRLQASSLSAQPGLGALTGHC